MLGNPAVNLPLPIYTASWVERSSVKVKCLVLPLPGARTLTAQFGVQCTNHKATAIKTFTLNHLFGTRPVVSASYHTDSTIDTNLVVTVPSNLTLSNSGRSVPLKELTFIPN